MSSPFALLTHVRGYFFTKKSQSFLRIFTVAPPLQDEFKFARNKTLKQLETDKRMAHHCYNFMHVFRKVRPLTVNTVWTQHEQNYFESLLFKEQ